MGLLGAAVEAPGAVEGADVIFECLPERIGGLAVGGEVQVEDLLAHYPPCHWVDVQAGDGTANAVGFDKGCPSSHEGVEDAKAFQGLALVELVPKRPLYKLREY